MCFTFLHSRQTRATKPRSVKLSFAKTFHKMSATPGCGCSSRNVQDEQQVFIEINIIAFTFFFTSGGSLSKDMMAFYKEQNKFSFARSLLSLVICTQLKLLLGQKSQTMRGSLYKVQFQLSAQLANSAMARLLIADQTLR